jgi:hypothetical protein
MKTRNILVTSTLVAALATGAHAQQTDAQQSARQQQVQALRQATPGRLIVPITATLTTPSISTTATQAITSSMAQAAGSFAIQRFAQTTTGEVAAFGMLTLNLTDPTSGAPRMIITEASMRVARGAEESSSSSSSSARPAAGTSAVMLSTASRATSTSSAQTSSTQGCEMLSLTLRPVQFDVLGMAVRLDQVNVDFISRTTTGQLRSLLCGATSVMDSRVGAAERTNRLNTLLDAVG